MTRTELERLVLLRRYQAGQLTQLQIAAQLRLSQRQMRRLLRRLEHEGESGLASRRRGRPSNNRVESSILATTLELIREQYSDFGPTRKPTFANEKLRGRRT